MKFFLIHFALTAAFLPHLFSSADLQASFMPSLFRSASDIEENTEVNQPDPLSVASHVGIAIDATTLPSNDQFIIHQKILETLKAHFIITTVHFETSRIQFDYHPRQDDQKEKLKYRRKTDKRLNSSLQPVIDALLGPLETWVSERNTFVDEYFHYRENARNVHLLRAVNERYANRRATGLRPEALDTALDGTYGRVMSLIIEQIKKDALGSVPPITDTFDPKRDGLWISLIAATLPIDQHSETVKSTVLGNSLKQVAFEGVHKGLIFKNSQLVDLIANLRSRNHNLPLCPDETYQSLLGAEAVLSMIMFQKYLVDPEAVRHLFDVNAEGLEVEQTLFAESSIRKERPYRLLATDLVPVEKLRVQDRLLSGIDLTDEEADLYGDAGNNYEKRDSIIEQAKNRILKKRRDAARKASGVECLTDEEADNWNYYNERQNEAKKAQIVESSQARLLENV